jgi:hypothetical protein
MLWAYPKAYREARGDEILETLFDASKDQGRPSLRDGADLVAHGLQRRFGLASERYAGRVLVLAAMPGLMMAAALAAIAFGFGEWRHPIDPYLPHFGPFLTLGPVIYLIWVTGALTVLVKPARLRWVAAGCVAVSVVATAVGDFAFDRPPLILVAMLVALGLPAVVAPVVDAAARRPALAVGACTGGVLCLILTTTTGPFGTTVGSSFYRAGLWLLSTWMPTLLIAGLAVMVGEVFTHRATVAGAVAVLMFPWAALSLRSWPDPYAPRPLSTIANTVALAALAGWLLSNWLYDLRRSTAS